MGIFIISLEIILYSILDYLNILFILELNSESRDSKLWDQKLLFKGFVFEILVE